MVKTNPECSAGKHSNCSGDGWDLERDEPAQCPCECHEPKIWPVNQPWPIRIAPDGTKTYGENS